MATPPTATDPSPAEDDSAPFDPSSVPPYPVLTLIGTGTDTITVDGAPFEGEDAFTQAIAYCAARAGELGGAVRVRGVDEEGQDWPLVVTEDGTLHEIPDPTAREGRRGKQPMTRRRLLGAIALGGVAVLGGGALVGGGIWAWDRAHEEPEVTPPPQYPGKGANLPVLPPHGYRAQAAWAVVVAKTDATPAVLPDGKLLLTASDKRLVRVDPVTGQEQWSGGAPSDSRGVFSDLTVNGQGYLTFASPSGLDAWPYATAGTSPSHLPIEGSASATPITSGDSPLFVLEDQSAQMLAGDALKTIDIPVPAVAAGATAGHAVAADSKSIVLVDSTNRATRIALGGIPQGGTVQEARLLGDDLLALLWQTDKTTTITTHNLANGKRLHDPVELTETGTYEAEPLGSHTSRTWFWRGALIQSGRLDQVSTLIDKAQQNADQQHDFTPQLVTDTALWGTFGDASALYTISDSKLVTQQSGAAIPRAVSSDEALAYVVTEKLGDQVLYALPRSAS